MKRAILTGLAGAAVLAALVAVSPIPQLLVQQGGVNQGVAGTLNCSTGVSCTVATGTATIQLGGAGGLTNGVLKWLNGAFATAVAKTDYAPPTSGTAIQKGDGLGGFSGYAGSTCTNQVLTTLGTNGAGTCSTVTDAYFGGMLSLSKVLPTSEGSAQNNTSYFLGRQTTPTGITVNLCSTSTAALCNTMNIGAHAHTSAVGSGGQIAVSSLSGLPVTYSQGGTGQTTAPADNVLVGNGSGWQLKTMPSCSATGSVLQFATGTDTFSCATDSGWTAPTLTNGWANFDNGAVYSTAGYRKLATGMICLKGLIKSGTLNTSAFQMTGTGYQPTKRILIGTIANGTGDVPGRLDIDIGGYVYPVSGANGWFALDGICFVP